MAAAPELVGTDQSGEVSSPQSHLNSLTLDGVTIHELSTRAEVEAALAPSSLGFLEAVGLDCEWVPETKAERNPVALLQIATLREVFLIRMIPLKDDIPPCLRELLSSHAILKAGVNVKNDAKRLHRDYDLIVHGTVELGAVAKDYNMASFGYGLKSLAASILGIRLAKEREIQMSQWDVALSTEQRAYAAADAVVSLRMLYRLFGESSRLLQEEEASEVVGEEVSSANIATRHARSLHEWASAWIDLKFTPKSGKGTAGGSGGQTAGSTGGSSHSTTNDPARLVPIYSSLGDTVVAFLPQQRVDALLREAPSPLEGREEPREGGELAVRLCVREDAPPGSELNARAAVPGPADKVLCEPEAEGLLSLPHAVLVYIMKSFVGRKMIGTLACTCKALDALAWLPEVWDVVQMKSIARYPTLEVVKSMTSRLNHIKLLDLQGCKGSKLASHAVAGLILRNSRTLTHIDFSGFTKITNSFLIDVVVPEVGHQLTAIQLRGCHHVGDPALEIMTRRCLALTKIVVSQCSAITNGFLRALGGSTIVDQLQVLYLRNCKITDDGVESLLQQSPRAGVALRSLDLAACPLGDGALAALTRAHLPLLSKIYLDNTSISGVALSAFVHHVRDQLDLIGLHGCKNLTTSSLLDVTTTQANLRYLYLYQLAAMNDSVIKSAAVNLRALDYLDICHCGDVTGDGLMAFVTHCQGPQLSLSRVFMTGTATTAEALVALATARPDIMLEFATNENDITIEFVKDFRERFPRVRIGRLSAELKSALEGGGEEDEPTEPTERLVQLEGGEGTDVVVGEADVEEGSRSTRGGKRGVIPNSGPAKKKGKEERVDTADGPP